MRLCIDKMRKQANLTQDALAKRIHKSRSAIAMYEAGYNDIPCSVLQDIARALHCAIGDLFEEDGEEEVLEHVS